MAFSAFDPRASILSKIGTAKRKHGNDIYVFSVAAKGPNVDVPIFYAEKIKDKSLEEMPYTSMKIVDTQYIEGDVGAATRDMISYIDIDVQYTDTDNIDVVDFGKAVKDWWQNQVRTNQCDFANITWINVTNDRYIEERQGHQVVYHYIITVRCLYYDICT